MAAAECVDESMVIGQTDGPLDGETDGDLCADSSLTCGTELQSSSSIGFDTCIVALLRDDGQLKKLHEAFAQIDVYQQQYDAFAKVIKGKNIIVITSL